MINNEKFRLEQTSLRKYTLLRFGAVCRAVISNGLKTGALIAFLLLMLLIWLFRVPIFQLQGSDLYTVLKKALLQLLLPLLMTGGTFAVITLFGTPRRWRSIHDNRRCCNDRLHGEIQRAAH
jgi:hypothetical protein